MRENFETAQMSVKILVDLVTLFPEPTNNVPPKKDLDKFEGWKVVAVPENDIAWLTCLVTGFPVPRYM